MLPTIAIRTDDKQLLLCIVIASPALPRKAQCALPHCLSRVFVRPYPSLSATDFLSAEICQQPAKSKGCPVLEVGSTPEHLANSDGSPARPEAERRRGDPAPPEQATPQRAPGPDTDPDAESQRAPKSAGPVTESAGNRHRERQDPTQRAAGPDPEP